MTCGSSRPYLFKAWNLPQAHPKEKEQEGHAVVVGYVSPLHLPCCIFYTVGSFIPTRFASGIRTQLRTSSIADKAGYITLLCHAVFCSTNLAPAVLLCNWADLNWGKWCVATMCCLSLNLMTLAQGSAFVEFCFNLLLSRRQCSVLMLKSTLP